MYSLTDVMQSTSVVVFAKTDVQLARVDNALRFVKPFQERVSD